MASRVMISFPEAFLKQVDELARAEHRSRSALVREALRHYIEARYGAMRPGDLPQVRAAVESMNALAKVNIFKYYCFRFIILVMCSYIKV